jgi:AraC-like DNA-binding protein
VRPANDLTGRTFGRLKVASRAGSDEHGKATWRCACDCGNSAVIVGYSLTRGDTLSCGCLVGLVANTRSSALYDGLTLAEHAARSGISSSTLDKRVRKYGEPFPSHLNKTRAEQELRVFEQDRENNRRAPSKRLGRAANTHDQTNTLSGRVTNCGARATVEDRASDAHLAEWMARADKQRIQPIQAIEPKQVRAEAALPVAEPDGHDVLWDGLTLGEWSRMKGETVRTLFVRMLNTGTPFPERRK